MTLTDLDNIDVEVLAEATRALMAGEGPNLLGDETDLARAQFDVEPGSAADLLGHWSVARGDPNPDRWGELSAFEQHVQTCRLCRYLEGLEALRKAFVEFEDCGGCGGGVDDHDYGPDQFGNARAFCRTEGE
jgi:hypothetical protein